MSYILDQTHVKIRKIQVKIGDKDLGYDTKYKYLGVTFHENLDFSMHKNTYIRLPI